MLLDNKKVYIFLLSLIKFMILYNYSLDEGKFIIIFIIVITIIIIIIIIIGAYSVFDKYELIQKKNSRNINITKKFEKSCRLLEFTTFFDNKFILIIFIVSQPLPLCGVGALRGPPNLNGMRSTRYKDILNIFIKKKMEKKFSNITMQCKKCNDAACCLMTVKYGPGLQFEQFSCYNCYINTKRFHIGWIVESKPIDQ
jgi:hypothetical protein